MLGRLVFVNIFVAVSIWAVNFGPVSASKNVFYPHFMQINRPYKISTNLLLTINQNFTNVDEHLKMVLLEVME